MTPLTRRSGSGTERQISVMDNTPITVPGKCPIAPARLRLDLEASPDAVRAALLDIGDRLKTWGLSKSQQTDTQIVLAEALNNVVEHAYPTDAGGRIRVEISRTEHHIDCAIRDSGTPMSEGPLPGAALPAIAATAVQDLPEGGFGWVLIRQLTTGLRYCRVEDENRLTMRLRLG
ncbi:ATP-binding protein [Maritalea mobilis]|uniref:ATP-binding protein n=1 Tax=Maritalea mobilis TaxID=483324 RepID=UPI001C97ECAA|nr:ATP-binding protein [Maritalea mobilis]MBY6202985.1 ATP-binding protein [Maritalea mobilis]